MLLFVLNMCIKMYMQMFSCLKTLIPPLWLNCFFFLSFKHFHLKLLPSLFCNSNWVDDPFQSQERLIYVKEQDSEYGWPHVSTLALAFSSKHPKYSLTELLARLQTFSRVWNCFWEVLTVVFHEAWVCSVVKQIICEGSFSVCEATYALLLCSRSCYLKVKLK